MRIRAFTALCLVVPAFSQAPEPDPLLDWLDARAQRLLDVREREVAAIKTVEAAERRKAAVRVRFLESIGGLPDYHGPLNARETGRIEADGYVIEKLLFDSLPGFTVTANVYRPSAPGGGRRAAVLLQAGHTQEGKPEPQFTAANLALQGFVAMTFDPIGQGEREQTYLPWLGRPVAGGSGNEHLTAGAQSLWIGQSVARYFIWDAMRAIDYLVTRPDVDPERIGAAGCSGGGALTTWVAALDSRIKAAAPACYVNSYRLLFRGPHPDSEMSPPGFLARGLDVADLIEMTAPKPWLILATEEDFFTPPGARLVFDEVRKWYSLFHAEDHVALFVGPGGHGTPRESREQLYSWMDRWLRDGPGGAKDRALREYTAKELFASPDGHGVGRKIFEIIRDDYRRLRRPGTLTELRAELVRLGLTDGPAPVVPGGKIYRPEGPGPFPAVILLEDKPASVPLYVSRSRATAPLAEALVRRGYLVLEYAPRASPATNDGRPFIGNWQENARADVVGLNLPILRARDIQGAVSQLAARPDVDAGSIRGIARGVKGMWLLLAAVADPRLQSIWLDRTPADIGSVLDRPLAQFQFDALIPGFLLRWELKDLESLAGVTRIFRTDSAGWMGEVIQPSRYATEGDEAWLSRFLALNPQK